VCNSLLAHFAHSAQVDIANRVDELLKCGETQLILQYVLQIMYIYIYVYLLMYVCNSQVDVANIIDELLKSGETQLIVQYVLQILSVIILDGLIIGLIALDYVRPIIAPRYGFWASNNLRTSYILFGILLVGVIVVDVAIYKWVKRKWKVL